MPRFGEFADPHHDLARDQAFFHRIVHRGDESGSPVVILERYHPNGIRRDRACIDDQRHATAFECFSRPIVEIEQRFSVDCRAYSSVLDPQHKFVRLVELPGKLLLGEYHLTMASPYQPDAATITPFEHQRMLALTTLHAGRHTPGLRQ
jgi:hypothetical protein